MLTRDKIIRILSHSPYRHSLDLINLGLDKHTPFIYCIRYFTFVDKYDDNDDDNELKLLSIKTIQRDLVILHCAVCQTLLFHLRAAVESGKNTDIFLDASE